VFILKNSVAYWPFSLIIGLICFHLLLDDWWIATSVTVGKSWRKHHVINYVTAINHHQQHQWRESRYDSLRMPTKADKDEMRSRLQTAMKAKQRASRFLTRDASRCQVKPTGSSQAETETETDAETESKYSLATRTSNIATVAVSGEHDGDKIEDRLINCKSTQMRCHAMEVKLHFSSLVT